MVRLRSSGNTDSTGSVIGLVAKQSSSQQESLMERFAATHTLRSSPRPEFRFPQVGKQKNKGCSTKVTMKKKSQAVSGDGELV